MANRAKHAFGTVENIDKALANGVIDAYDILFVKDATGKPCVGWIDKDGNKVLVKEEDKIVVVDGESLPQSGVAGKMYIFKDEVYIWTGVEFRNVCKPTDLTELENVIATKADAKEVNAKIDKVATDSVQAAKVYTDGKVEAAVKEHLVKKYEISDTPEGTLVDYRDGEIRIMCKNDAVYTEQSVGVGGDPNCYYVTLKTYVFNDNVVGYREYLGNQFDSETLTDLKTDEFGHRYQPTWLGVAKYDKEAGVWNYYGKNSNAEKMIGWDYRIDFYDANGVVIDSDSVRINLTNEECHFINEPYYVGKIKKEIDTKIEEKIAEVETAFEVVEF